MVALKNPVAFLRPGFFEFFSKLAIHNQAARQSLNSFAHHLGCCVANSHAVESLNKLFNSWQRYHERCQMQTIFLISPDIANVFRVINKWISIALEAVGGLIAVNFFLANRV